MTIFTPRKSTTRHRTRPGPPASAALLALLASLLSTIPAADASLPTTGLPGTASADGAAIDWEPFEFVAASGESLAAEFGRLQVVERRDVVEPSPIDLALVRFRSTAARPGPPIVVLPDGPGLSGIEAARGPSFSAIVRLRDVADVIVMDPRGVGLSQPALSCSQRLSLPAGKPITLDAFVAETRKRLRTCVRFWQGRGVDPAGYHAVESAEDVETLREALGVERVVLWAQGYGTHVALAAIRRHPAGIARAVLHGVHGPDHTLSLPRTIHASLRKLSRLVARDAAIGTAMPDLLGSIERLAERLAGDPVRVRALDPFTGRLRNVLIDDFLLRAAAAAVVGDTEGYSAVPRVIAEMERGEFGEEIGAAALEVRGDSVGSLAAWVASCASGVSERRWKKIRRQEPDHVTGRLVDAGLPEACDVVGAPDLGEDFRAKVRSDVPALFVSGTLDGRTPPGNANEVRKGFSEHEHLVIAGGGHYDLVNADPRIIELAVDFLLGRRLGTRRIVLPPLQFQPVQ